MITDTSFSISDRRAPAGELHPQHRRRRSCRPRSSSSGYIRHLTHERWLSAHTAKNYRRDIEALLCIAAERTPGELTAHDIRRGIAQLLGRGLDGRSLARMLSAWRAFYAFAIESDAGISANPCTGLRPPRSPKRLPSAPSPDEAVRLVTGGESDPLSIRDRALFELAYSSGLRLSELASLDLDRLDLTTGEVRVWGKGEHCPGKTSSHRVVRASR